MDSRASFPSQESTAQMKMMSTRKPPLHTCAVSVLVTANRAFAVVQGMKGLLGTLVKVAVILSTFASPIIFFMKYQWIILAFLSFIDTRILAVEAVIETHYPQSSIVFNKIDELVRTTETLPGKFNEAVNELPSSVHPILVLDWGLVQAISLLNFAAATLTHWRRSKDAREKEIVVDTSGKDHHHHQNDNQAAGDQVNNNSNKSNSSSPPLGAVMKGSYKEALTKGKKERKSSKKLEEKKREKESGESKNEGNVETGNDEILNLFDSAWLMNRSQNSEGNTTRSFSFHGD